MMAADGPTVVIAEFMDEAAVARLSAATPTLYDPALVDAPERLAALLTDARALVVRNRTQVRAPLLETALRLECVGRLGVGLDNIDVALCRARGVAVYPATGANDVAVAEYVLGAALTLVRRSFGATGPVAAGRWPRNDCIGGELAGRTMGLVGFGGTARAVARRAAAFDMRLAAFDPFLPAADPAWRDVRRMAEIEPLLAEADVLSLHVPLTETTRLMIDERALALMRPGAVLVNAARGGVVDEAAVVEALRRGRLGGAALDVFETEPLDAVAGGRFADAPNLLLSPHVAGVTVESNIRVSHLIAEKVAAHLGLRL